MARSFDGVDDKIVATSNSTFPQGGSFSVLMIAKPNTAAAVHYLLDRNKDTTNNGWGIYKAGSDAIGFVKGGVVAIASTLTWIENVWNVCGIIHRTGIEVSFIRKRLDTGVLETNTQANTSAINTASNTLNKITLAQHGTGDGIWGGSIGLVVVWNIDISDRVMTSFVGANGNLTWFPFIVQSPPAVVGYWPLWGYSDPEPDLSGLRQNGTVTGAVWSEHAPLGPYVPSPNYPVFPATIGAAAAQFFQHSGPLRLPRPKIRTI